MRMHEAVNLVKGGRADSIHIRGSSVQYRYDSNTKTFLLEGRISKDRLEVIKTSLFNYFDRDPDVEYSDWVCVKGENVIL